MATVHQLVSEHNLLLTAPRRVPLTEDLLLTVCTWLSTIQRRQRAQFPRPMRGEGQGEGCCGVGDAPSPQLSPAGKGVDAIDVVNSWVT